MKKSLIALAVMAAAGAASAQSSVTLFGIIDGSLTWGKGSVADTFQIGTNGYNSSRLGFRGTEDLGGGMSASFWLETRFNTDTGIGTVASNTNNQASGVAAAPVGTLGLNFQARSTVSLAGNWGEVRLGRDYVPAFWNKSFDAFGLNGAGTSLTQTLGIAGVTATRASNSIGYFLPARLGGIYGQAMYYSGDNPDNLGATRDDGDGYGFRVGYASGPFNVAFGWGRTEYAAGDSRQMNIGGQWDFGVARLLGHVVREELGALDGRGFNIGALVPVGPGEIRVAYSRYKTDAAGSPRSAKIALGYVHNLSKRTAVYTTVAHVKNSGGAALALNAAITGANGKSTGVDVGLRHSF